jgi:hypothetical protein
MTVKSYLSHAIAKPIFAAMTASILDHYIMCNPDLKSSAYFGAAVGAGIFSVSWVEPIVSPLFPTATPLNNGVSKMVEGRIVEIALGSVSGYLINSFVLKNEYTSKDLLYKVGIVAIADIAGESFCQFLLIV